MATTQFDWYEYFKLAQELGKRREETSLRTAISRAYYFVFHLALDRVLANDSSLKHDKVSHADLWKMFSNNPEIGCQTLAAIGSRMRDKRVRADYRDVFVRVEDEVPWVLQDAQDFANVLATLEKQHP